eukprot:316861-Prymnesium_polylepis.1
MPNAQTTHDSAVRRTPHGTGPDLPPERRRDIHTQGPPGSHTPFHMLHVGTVRVPPSVPRQT